MTLAKQKTMMTISTFLRMGGTLVVTVAFARFLGPDQFGLFASSLAYSTLVTLLSDYGLSPYVLRSAGAEPHRVETLTINALVIKIALSGLGGLVGLGYALATGTDSLTIHLIIFVAVAICSGSDFIYIILRIRDSYTKEACVVFISTFLLIAINLIVAYYTSDILYCSISFLATRLVYFILTAIIIKQSMIHPRLTHVSFSKQVAMVKSSSNYAIDGILTNLISQIDVLLVSLMLNRIDVGLYQAGARMVQSVGPLAVVLSTVYLPKLAAATSDPAQWDPLSKHLLIEFFVISLVVGAAFLTLGGWASDLVFGPSYQALAPLWPAFAALAFSRITLAGYGVLLLARQQTKVRIWSQVCGLGVLLVGAAWALPTFGFGAMPWVLVATTIPMFVGYAHTLREQNKAFNILLPPISTSAFVFISAFCLNCYM